MNIRPETEADRLPVGEVLVKAFKRFDEYNMVSAMRSKKNFLPNLSLVVLEGGKAAGYALCSEAQLLTEKGSQPCLSLAPIAVLPELQARGLGLALLTEIIARAKETNFPFIVAAGKPNLYLKAGFSQADTYGVKPPFALDPAFFLLCPLKEGIPSGTLSYPPLS